MASFTAQIDSPTKGKDVINPTPAGSPVAGMVGDVAQFLSKGLSAYQTYQQGVKVSEATKAKKQEEAAINSSVRTAWDFNMGYVEGVQELDPAAGIPEDVKNDARQLGRLKKAAEQGRVSSSAYQLQGEKVMTDLLNRYPDQSFKVVKALKEVGFDHYLMRDFEASDLERKRAEGEVDFQTGLQRDVQKEYVSAAAKAGVAVGDPIKDAVAGQGILKASAEFDAASKLSQAVRQNQEMEQKARDEALKMADRQGMNAIALEAQVKIGALSQQIGSLYNSMDPNNPADMKLINELAPKIPAGISAWRNSAHAQASRSGLGPEVHKMIDDTADTLKKDFDNLYTGALSHVQMNTRAVKSMQEQWALQDGESMQVYGQLSRVFGKNVVNAWFGDDPIGQLPQDIRDKLKAEVKGMKLDDRHDTGVLINNIVQVMKGEKGLSDMPQAQAEQVIPTIYATARGLQKTIAADPTKADLGSLDKWSNNYSAMLVPAVEIQTASAKITSVSKAAQLIATADARVALEAAIANPAMRERGLAMMIGSRGATAHLLEAAKNTPAGDNTFNRVYKPVFNEKTLQFEAVLDPKELAAYQRQTRMMASGGKAGTLPNQALQSPQVSSEMQTRINTMNILVNHLVQTRKYDEDIPTKTTNKELRRHYALGVPLVQGDGKPVKSSHDEWVGKVHQVEQQLKDLPNVIASDPERRLNNPAGRATYEPMARAAARRNGVPEEVYVQLVDQESGWDPQAANPGSTARGLNQFIESTAKSRGLIKDGKDLRFDPEASLEEGAKYLAELGKKFNGDWLKALKAYGVTHPSNWGGNENDPQYLATVEKFRRALGG